jgi:hypothetical protein
MTSVAYSSYDGYGRQPSSRRQSMGYGIQPGGYSYSDPSGMYSEPVHAENYPQPTYQIYAPPQTSTMSHRRLTGPSYEDLALRDSYYPDEMPPYSSAVVPHSAVVPRRQRRHSAVSFTSRPPPMDNYRRPSTTHIKFKRKGAFSAGINLSEAQSHVRLSSNDSYSIHDFHAERGRIHLKIRWAGYNSLTYEIPLDGYDGHVSLQTLARRISRACVHYLQANVIPVPWDRVELHHLEEISYGVWQPMLSTR